MTADTPVIAPFPEDDQLLETTIEPQVIPATESIPTQTEDQEDPQEASYEVSSIAVRTDNRFENLLNTCKQARIFRRFQRTDAKYEQDLQMIWNRRPTAHAVGNIYLCPHGRVWHISETCARSRTDAPVIMRKPCAYCRGEPIPLPQSLHDILYPQQPSASSTG